MYKVTNTSSKPVLVEGVALGIGESASVPEITEMMKFIARKGTIMITTETAAKGSSNAKILTEEGTGTTKKRRSSKNLNE